MNPRLPKTLSAVAVVAALIAATPLARPAHACVQPFVGDICTFAFNFCPAGFVPADGRLLSIADDATLFSVIGATFGGDGQTTFAVPNLQGNTAVGTGSGDALPEVVLGQTNGSTNTVFVVARPGRPPVPAAQLPSLGLTVCIAALGTTPSPP
jgi:hypothetical protein